MQRSAITNASLETDRTTWSQRQTLRSCWSAANHVADRLTTAMTRAGWPNEEINHVRIACIEAMTNAIMHGNETNQDGRIEIQLSCDPDRVQVEITDEGKGFDPHVVPDPRTPERLERPGGRGICLMRACMCRVEFCQTGKQVRMWKYRNKSA